MVAVQDPLTLRPDSEPQPDLMLLRPRADFYENANPTPADTLLVIEICDTSLRYAQEIKVPLYAAQGVPEVWLLDLKQQRLQIYREPGADGYRVMLRPDPTEVVTPMLLPSLCIPVTEIWSTVSRSHPPHWAGWAARRLRPRRRPVPSPRAQPEAAVARSGADRILHDRADADRSHPAATPLAESSSLRLRRWPCPRLKRPAMGRIIPPPQSFPRAALLRASQP